MFASLALAGSLSAQSQLPTRPVVNVSKAAAKSPTRITCDALGPSDKWNDSARFVAGLNDAAFAPDLTAEQQASWTTFAKSVDSDWNRLRRGHLDRIDSWRGKALGGRGNSGVAFYPFSGPDAANVLAFYPEAKEYVLIGLEPPGCIPSEIKDYSPDFFPNLRASLQSSVVMGFFKTEQMRRDFRESDVTGVLPVLLFTLSRAGYTIEDVTRIAIIADGSMVPMAPGVKRESRGVAIRFNDPRHGSRTLRYFSVNIENATLKWRPGTVKYLQNLTIGGTLVKSASYLMHKRYFSTIRGVILAKSDVVVEDDSGVPFQFFDANTWNVRLYGTYSKPIDLFKNSYQDDLFTAYSTRQDIEPMEFGIGYKWRRNESNLLVAFRKSK